MVDLDAEGSPTPEQFLAAADHFAAWRFQGKDEHDFNGLRSALRSAIEYTRREERRRSVNATSWYELRDRLLAWYLDRSQRIGPPRVPFTTICTGLDEVAIYSLADPADPTVIRYVGMSAAPYSRYRSHVKRMPWALDLIKQGRFPVMILVEWTPHYTIARDREIYWIKHFRAMGMADLNVASTQLVESTYEAGE